MTSLITSQELIKKPSSYVNYNIPGVDKYMLSADQIISKWSEDRKMVARSLRSSSIGSPFDGHFPLWLKCKCKVNGQTCIKGVCYGCLIAGRFYNKGLITLGENVTIVKGVHTGTILITNQIV